MNPVLRKGIGFLSPKVGSIQMSQFVSLPRLEMAMYRPSRDQSLANVHSVVFKSSFASPSPAADFSKRSQADSRPTLKTTRRPSGDQIGMRSSVVPKLKRELTPRTRSRIQMLVFPPRASMRS